MRSYNLYTEEIDFAEDAVAELKAEFDTVVAPDGLLKNTVAIMYTDSVLDASAFIEEFGKVFSFPVIGCSGMTMFDRSHGVSRSGICVMLLTSDDVEFVSSITAPLEKQTMEQELRRAYERGLISLGKTPGLIILFADTFNVCPGDDLVEEMNLISGNIALFGGIAATALDSAISFAFTEQEAGSNRVAMLLLAGDSVENFLFRYEMSAENTNICNGTVTALTNDWAVGELNGKSFLEYMKKSCNENGEPGTDYTFKYISNPFMVKKQMENGDEIAMLRNLANIDPSTEAGFFVGRIPVGADISMAAISKESVAGSSKAAFEHILATANERGLHPTAFLCISCKARYFNLSAARNEEVNAYDQVLDENAAVIGMYSCGEICPQPSSTGGFFNIYHNSTFAILAL